jgi:hypothetical protein
VQPDARPGRVSKAVLFRRPAARWCGYGVCV